MNGEAASNQLFLNLTFHQDDFERLGFIPLRDKSGNIREEVRRLWKSCDSFISSLSHRILQSIQSESQITVDHQLIEFLRLEGAGFFGHKSIVRWKFSRLPEYRTSDRVQESFHFFTV